MEILMIIVIIALVITLIVSIGYYYIWCITHEAFEKGYKEGKLDGMKENRK